MTGVFVVPIKVTGKVGWMDDLGVYVLFSRISVISGPWKGEHERLCAMKRHLGSNRISPPANCSAAEVSVKIGVAEN